MSAKCRQHAPHACELYAVAGRVVGSGIAPPARATLRIERLETATRELRVQDDNAVNMSPAIAQTDVIAPLALAMLVES